MMAAPVMEKTIEPVVAKTALAEATNNEAGEAYHNVRPRRRTPEKLGSNTPQQQRTSSDTRTTSSSTRR